MSITDELRKWAEDNTLQDTVLTTYPPQHAVHGVLETILRIADRIDAEHERIRAESIIDMTDESMAEHGWVRLPVDADGEYINIHDWIEVDDGKRVRVDAITPNAVYWWDGDGCHWCQSFTVSHYHAPTVEDVLREFALAVCKDDALTIREGVVVEYAKRLTLAEGEDA